MSAAVPELNCCCCCCCNFIVVNLQVLSSFVFSYRISMPSPFFFPFHLSSRLKKKKKDDFHGGVSKGPQRKDFDPSFLITTLRPKNITKMISSVQTIASVSALKVRLLSRCFAHSCTIARARCGALRLNRGKNWEVSQGQRSRVDGIFVSECLFSLLHPKGWGKHRRELISMGNEPDPLFGDPVRAVRSRL